MPAQRGPLCGGELDVVDARPRGPCYGWARPCTRSSGLLPGRLRRSLPWTPPRPPPGSRPGPAHSGRSGTGLCGRKWWIRPARVGAVPVALPDSHVQSIKGQVGVQARQGGLPVHDPTRVHIRDESDVHPPRQRSEVGGGTSRLRGNVGDLRLIGLECREVAACQVRDPLLTRCAARRAGRLGPADALSAPWSA